MFLTAGYGLSTYTVDDLVRYARSHTSLTPVLSAAGWGREPAVSIVQQLMSFILGSPFSYPWNRIEDTVTLTVGIQDVGYICEPYSSTSPYFGYLERATLSLAGPPAFNQELEIRPVLSLDSTQIPPIYISFQTESVTDPQSALIDCPGFRVFPTPDQPYNVDIVYQLGPPIIYNIYQSLDPIPDRCINIMQQGFLAKCYEMVGDPRADVAMDLFIREVIGLNTGLADSFRNLFQSERLISMADIQRVTTLRNFQIGIPANPNRGQ
jgi:hypothetical protein